MDSEVLVCVTFDDVYVPTFTAFTMRIATSPLAIVIAHSRASTFAGTHISLADYFLGSRSSSLRPCFLANSTPLNHRAFSKPYSSSSSRPGKQLAALNVKPQQKSAPRATTNTVDDVEFPMADQYKYIAHLLTMPIRTPEATRKVNTLRTLFMSKKFNFFLSIVLFRLYLSN